MKETTADILNSSKRDGDNDVPAIVEFADEWRDCGVYGLQCTRDGRFRNAKGKELTVFYHRNGLRVFACHDGTKDEYICRTLIAKAWLPDYYDGCGLKYLDGNKLNIHADNTEVCNMTEYRSWMASLEYQNKHKDLIKEHGEFRDCGLDGISIAKDGYTLRNGILHKPHRSMKYGKIGSIQVSFKIDGKIKYYLLADLMARAWLKTKYYEGCYIIYRDYDKTNFAPENLKIADNTAYNKFIASWNGSKKLSIEGEIEKLKNIKKQCDISIRFLKTGDFTEINKWVEDYLFPTLMKKGRRAYELGRDKCYLCVCIAIERLYLLLDTNRGAYQMEWYAEKKLECVVKYGEITHERLPLRIERAITSLELDKLREKFNSTIL